MFEKHTKTFQYGQHTVTIETGEIARQAAGAVKVSMGDTVVLVAVTANKEPMPQAKSPAAFSRGKANRARKKSSPAV